MLDKLSRDILERVIEIPCYDREDHRFGEIKYFLEEKNLKYEYFYPGNDLFSHKLSFEEGNKRSEFFIRYSTDIYTSVVYERAGNAGYLFRDLAVISKKGVEFSAFLDGLNFAYIPSSQLLSCDLGDFPLTRGLHSTSLFSVYFEDQ